MRARELFETIVKQAHHNGEPGLLFLDAANRGNPVPHLYPLEATNPCGEQWLGPYENCCLGSINLAEHCAPDGQVDWEGLRDSVETATRFLDNVVDANAYVPAVPRLEEAAHKARRIGLGIMGLADLMYHAGVRYGSVRGQEFGSRVMEFIRFHAMRTSIRLAHERGAFPAIKGSIYDFEDMRWTPPQPLVAYSQDWGCPTLDWGELTEEMKKYGIRNAAQTTVAPTGTIATVAGCEGTAANRSSPWPTSGMSMTRARTSRSPTPARVFEQALEQGGHRRRGQAGDHRAGHAERYLPGHTRPAAGDPGRVRRRGRHLRRGTCAHAGCPAGFRGQLALEDDQLSSTDATADDVARAYLLAWELGCKGITVYVTGSRDKVVLETKATASKKQPIPRRAA